MQLWGIDIVGGVMLVDPATGVLREAKVVTGIDDHSRFCVIASVVERATSRAVCLALAAALARFGVPEEILTDNGKQFTDRFGQRGEVLFDKICRRNGITHRLTMPASPNQNGKVERFHGTFRPDFLDTADAFTVVEAAQAAVDAWVEHYNTDRPHQALDEQLPVTPAERFTAVPAERRGLVDSVAAVGNRRWRRSRPSHGRTSSDVEVRRRLLRRGWVARIEFDRVVPPSGMITVAGKAFWLGTTAAGLTVRVWADADVIHLLVGRHPGQVDPLASERQRPGPAGRGWRGQRRTTTAACAGTGRRGRGRPGRVQGRHRVVGPSRRARCGDPRRPPSRGADRDAA